jgi:hypothetical protein
MLSPVRRHRDREGDWPFSTRDGNTNDLTAPFDFQQGNETTGKDGKSDGGQLTSRHSALIGVSHEGATLQFGRFSR